MTDQADKYRAEEDDEYLTRVVIDTCARTFRLYSNEGDERVVIRSSDSLILSIFINVAVVIQVEP